MTDRLRSDTHLLHVVGAAGVADDVALLAELGRLAVEGESALRNIHHVLPVHSRVKHRVWVSTEEFEKGGGLQCQNELDLLMIF